MYKLCLIVLCMCAQLLPAQSKTDSLVLPGEKHFKNVRQLTFGGNNAEAYFSRDGKRLIFQSDWPKINNQGCDQIFSMTATVAKQDYTLISTGKGRTTCSYYLPDGRMVYASTHEAAAECPAFSPRTDGRYVWPVFDSFEIYITDKKGKNPTPLITGKGYDAEATISPDGRYMVFTSTRSGDLELWRYEFKTKQLLQLTNELGYDGGAFFSRDGQQIVWRASRPSGEAVEPYKSLLAKGLVEPNQLQIFVMNADGTGKRQVTNLKGANWAPFFHPDGKRIIFCSNHQSVGKGRPRFNLFMINVDGTGLEQISQDGVFDAFPMFSYNGKSIVFSSNRNNGGSRDTNVFIADWVE